MAEVRCEAGTSASAVHLHHHQMMMMMMRRAEGTPSAPDHGCSVVPPLRAPPTTTTMPDGRDCSGSRGGSRRLCMLLVPGVSARWVGLRWHGLLWLTSTHGRSAAAEESEAGGAPARILAGLLLLRCASLPRPPPQLVPAAAQGCARSPTRSLECGGRCNRARLPSPGTDTAAWPHSSAEKWQAAPRRTESDDRRPWLHPCMSPPSKRASGDAVHCSSPSPADCSQISS
jgi:hypothetical protein